MFDGRGDAARNRFLGLFEDFRRRAHRKIKQRQRSGLFVNLLPPLNFETDANYAGRAQFNRFGVFQKEAG